MRKLGRYILLDAIAQGGFAEVYRGLEDRGQGAQRLVAVKCILEEHASQPAFRKFFREEMRLSLGLNHPNIVQTYDCGEEDGAPYLVFELVPGKTLKQVIDRLHESSQQLPAPLAVFIAEQAARALQYAHSFHDPLKGSVDTIVHRDITPHNLILSYVGVPKLIDFGIAKATQADDLTRTSEGIVKGKPTYLSPEQVLGLPLDGRCDIFALGIVLWEALTGRRIFAGIPLSEVVEVISNPSASFDPPSRHNPAVPPALDRITLRALERDRDRRFQTAGEFQAELSALLGKGGPDAGAASLSSLLKQVFPEEIEKENKDLKALLAEAKGLSGAKGPSGAKARDATATSTRQRERELPAVGESPTVELEAKPKPRAQTSISMPNFSAEMRKAHDQVDSRLKIVGIERTAEETIFHVEGVLDERADMLQAFDRLTMNACLNLKGIARANSQGVKAWLVFFKHCIETGVKIRYVECSPAITHFLELFKKSGAVTSIDSVMAPFDCTACKQTFEYLIQTPDFKAIKPQIQNQRCPACSGLLELAELPQEYFSFLGL
jgi:serine/threonine-protein kinase